MNDIVDQKIILKDSRGDLFILEGIFENDRVDQFLLPNVNSSITRGFAGAVMAGDHQKKRSPVPDGRCGTGLGGCGEGTHPVRTGVQPVLPVLQGLPETERHSPASPPRAGTGTLRGRLGTEDPNRAPGREGVLDESLRGRDGVVEQYLCLCHSEHAVGILDLPHRKTFEYLGGVPTVVIHDYVVLTIIRIEAERQAPLRVPLGFPSLPRGRRGGNQSTGQATGQAQFVFLPVDIPAMAEKYDVHDRPFLFHSIDQPVISEPQTMDRLRADHILHPMRKGSFSSKEVSSHHCRIVSFGSFRSSFSALLFQTIL